MQESYFKMNLSELLMTTLYVHLGKGSTGEKETYDSFCSFQKVLNCIE